MLGSAIRDWNGFGYTLPSASLNFLNSRLPNLNRIIQMRGLTKSDECQLHPEVTLI